MASIDQRRNEPCPLPSVESTDSFWHTQPSPLLLGHRSTRSLPEYADVVIVGSGITGTSVVYHLLNDRSGNAKPDVVMLEAREACWGATGRNGGHCQPILFEHYTDPSIGRFELSNYHTLLKLIEDKSIDCEWVSQPGCIGFYTTRQLDAARDALQIINESAPDLGSYMRLVTDKAELAKLRVPTAHGAMVTSVAARLWPYKLVAGLLESLIKSTELSGTFNLQTLTPVEAIAEDSNGGGVKVTTARGNIIAKKVILATNGYTSHLLPSFADLIVPVRGTMSALKPFPSVAEEHRLRTSLVFIGDGMDDYLIQRPNERGGHLMFGGGRQHDDSVGVADDNSISEKTASYLKSALISALGLPEGADGNGPDSMEALRIWTGIMAFSRDDLPWIGLAPGLDGSVFVSAGYTGHGMPNAFLCGKSIAVTVKAVLNGADNSTALEAGAQAVGLPDSYRLTEERLASVKNLSHVAVKDWAEIKRGQTSHKILPV